MAEQGRLSVVRFSRSLSARLLVLTIIVVLVGEVFIYVPSIARFRETYLLERVAAARLAALAVEAAPDQMVTEELSVMLLARAEVQAISINRPESRRLILEDPDRLMPDRSYSLLERSWVTLIVDAFDSLFNGAGRTIRVVAAAPADSAGTEVDIVMSETPMHLAMLDYSWRILLLSLVLAGVTAGAIFLILHLMIVRPVRRMTESLVAFRREPESTTTEIAVSLRRDEIGIAQRELKYMQRRVRAALRQRKRLAAVGEAVSKINHDLRNMLSTAALVSDRLALASDPEVKRQAPALLQAIDRAIALCTQTMSYARAEPPAPRREQFQLYPLVNEVSAGLPLPASNAIIWRNDVAPEFDVHADRDQLYRILMNLCKNAVEALAQHAPGGTVRVNAERMNEGVAIDVADTGPGLPEQVREHLFEAFVGTLRAGGTGLGLAIARDLAKNHGGDLVLLRSDPTGTVFRLTLPDAA